MRRFVKGDINTIHEMCGDKILVTWKKVDDKLICIDHVNGATFTEDKIYFPWGAMKI